MLHKMIVTNKEVETNNHTNINSWYICARLTTAYIKKEKKLKKKIFTK